MTGGWLAAAEIALVLGIALFFAFRELRILRKLRLEREAAARSKGTVPPDGGAETPDEPPPRSL
jgi:hypothetical protein